MGSPFQSFVSDLTTCGVMSAEDLQVFLAPSSNSRSYDDAETLAEELVRQNLLTEFQATALIKGQPQTLQIENYVLQEELGSGGMGTVYKAEHRRLKRVVALKVLAPSALHTERAIQRFHREIEAVAKLSHPNIVAALDAGEDTGTHFLVMDYVVGRDLSRVVVEEGPLSLSRALNCISQAACGLQEAHSRGIIHRDIKPANLLLDENGTVKLLDLGLARFNEPREDEDDGNGLTQTGMIMGTADYMSPEQALDTRLADARSDIYSLGCTLHFLLLGRALYGGKTVMSKLLAHREKPIPSIRAARPDVPEPVDALFAKMVAKTSATRFQSMGEVLRALESCVQQLPQAASRSPGLSAADDDLLSINLDPVDTIDVRDEPRPSTNSSLSQIRARGRSRSKARFQGVLFGTTAAVLTIATGLGLLFTIWNPKTRSVVPAAQTAGSAKTVNPKISKPKLAEAPARPLGVAKLPPLPRGSSGEILPGLAVKPAVLMGVSRWQITTVAPMGFTQAIDWSPDGTRVVTGGLAGDLRIYRVADWRLLSILVGHRDSIQAVAWNPEGSRLATMGNAGTVRLWHADGTPGPVLEGTHQGTGLEWSPNGEWLALHTDNFLGLWSADGKLAKIFPSDPVPPTDVAWSPDGTQLVSARGRRLVVVNLDGTPVRNAINFTHPQPLLWVAWSSQGQIATLDDQGKAYLHSTHRADPIVLDELTANSVAFSPDGQELAFSNHPGVEIFTAQGKRTAARHPAISSHGVAWSRDGKRIAWTGNTIGAWEPWGEASGLGGFNASQCTLQPEGLAVSVHPGDGLRWWSAEGAMQRFEPLNSSVDVMKWSPDSRTLAIGFDSNDLACSIENGPLTTQFECGRLLSLAWKPDSQQILVGGYSNTAKILDLRGNLVQELPGHSSNVIHAGWGQAGHLATSDGYQVHLWKPGGTTGMVLNLRGPVHGLAWSPDGRFLAVATERDHVPLFRDDGTLVLRIPADSIRRVAWSPDGRTLALSGLHAGTALWNADGSPGKPLPAAAGKAIDLGWSRDNRIVALFDDNKIRSWDGASAQMRWVAVAKPGGTATINALGNITNHSGNDVDQVLSHVVEREHGRVEAVPPSQFEEFVRSIPRP